METSHREKIVRALTVAWLDVQSHVERVGDLLEFSIDGDRADDDVIVCVIQIDCKDGDQLTMRHKLSKKEIDKS